MQAHVDLNIEEFCHFSANILIFLLQRFPQKQTLYVEDIVEADTDEFGMKSDRYFTALASIQWLAEEGFIRFKHQVKQEAFDDTVLTSKGLSSLFSKLPDNNSLTLADALRDGENPRQRMLLVLAALGLI